jgi:hypothetical protein
MNLNVKTNLHDAFKASAAAQKDDRGPDSIHPGIRPETSAASAQARPERMTAKARSGVGGKSDPSGPREEYKERFFHAPQGRAQRIGARLKRPAKPSQLKDEQSGA